MFVTLQCEKLVKFGQKLDENFGENLWKFQFEVNSNDPFPSPTHPLLAIDSQNISSSIILNQFQGIWDSSGWEIGQTWKYTFRPVLGMVVWYGSRVYVCFSPEGHLCDSKN